MNKIKQIVCAAGIMLLAAGCGNKTSFTVNGTITSAALEPTKVYLFDPEQPNVPVDSTETHDGKFCFKGKVEKPWLAVAVSDKQMAQFVVEPGQIVIVDDSIGGTTLNDRLQAMTAKVDMSDIEGKMQELLPLYYAATSPEERAVVEAKIDSLESISNRRVMEACSDLYEENRDNLLGVMAIETMVRVGDFDYASLSALLEDATEEVKNNEAVQMRLEQLRCAEQTSVGKHYTDITGVDGKLSDLIDGKVALVDFYASWCGPCKNEIKDHIVPIWNKYRSRGLVVVGLNVWERGTRAEREEAHRKVMTDFGITYPQLVDSTKTATTTYGVNGIPQIMLIGRDGTILARDLRGAAIEEAVVAALK